MKPLLLTIFLSTLYSQDIIGSWMLKEHYSSGMLAISPSYLKYQFVSPDFVQISIKQNANKDGYEYFENGHFSVDNNTINLTIEGEPTKGTYSIDGDSVLTLHISDSKLIFSKILHDKNTFTIPKGKKFEGKFEGNFIDGFGRLITVDGKYEGQFKNGIFNGQGTHTFTNGDKYIGNHRNGKYEGFGTFYFSNGETYIGEFKDNRFHGKGILYELNGNILSGLYEDGLFQGSWSVDGVENYLRDKYTQFKGLKND